MTALVPDLDPAHPDGLTANKLRAAGTDYPPDVATLYTHLLPGTSGPETELLLERIEKESGATNPYDLARAVERFLRDPANFTYDTDVSDVQCGGRGVAECFVVSRRGYCEYYATTMAVMLRLRGIPTRFVEGFLPGERDARGIETVRRARAHAWVEVYFPGYGWVDFDPTGGGVASDTSLPAGSARRLDRPVAQAEHQSRAGQRRARSAQDLCGGSVRSRDDRRGARRARALSPSRRSSRRRWCSSSSSRTSGVLRGRPRQTRSTRWSAASPAASGMPAAAQSDRLRVRGDADGGPAGRGPGPRPGGDVQGGGDVRAARPAGRSAPGAGSRGRRLRMRLFGLVFRRPSRRSRRH